MLLSSKPEDVIDTGSLVLYWGHHLEHPQNVGGVAHTEYKGIL